MHIARLTIASILLVTLSACSLISDAPPGGDGLIGLARTGLSVPSEKILARTKSEIDNLIVDLGIDKQLSYQMRSLEPQRVIMVKEDLREKSIRNAVVLVEGDVDVDSIRNSVVIATGKINARVASGSVLAAGDDVNVTHVGGRDESTLVLTREQIHSESVYGSTVFAPRGAHIGAPTHVYAVNTQVSTPHPSRVRVYHVRGNPLEGNSSKLYW